MFLSGTAEAEDIPCRVLQYRAGRLYLDTGEEANVFPWCRFTVRQGDSVVYRGLIEHAYLGIAVSEPAVNVLDSFDISALDVRVEPASVEDHGVVVIGTDIAESPLLVTRQDSIKNTHAATVQIRTYNSHTALQDDFSRGVLDGCLSFRRILPMPGNTVTMSQPWMKVAAMVPNVSRPYNQDGQLTTSMYYRLDPDRLSLHTDGDAPSSVSSFLHPSDETGRRFPYDAGRGRDLLAAMAERPTQLRLYASSPSLARLAAYFADVLSRDRCQVTIVDDSSIADVRFVYVSADSSLPSAGLHQLYVQVARDAVPGTLARENVSLIQKYFQSAAGAVDRNRYDFYLALAEQRLMEDLGVFPLFRPTVFYTGRATVRGLRFDNNGLLDMRAATRVLLPAPPSENRP